MAPPDEVSILEKLYDIGQRLSESSGTKNESDYRGIISAAKGTTKSKQLAAQLIPRFFKYFPNLSPEAINTQLDLCEEDELGIRVQAIRGLPLLCKDTPQYLPEIANVLGQLLLAEENLEKDAVQKALISLFQQDVKASLTALFGLIENSDETIREKVLYFLKDKVFSSQADLLKPKEEIESHITALIKQCRRDVTGAELHMFVDFLQSLSIFGEKASSERMQELLEIIEGQADLDVQFNVSDTDHIDKLVSCLCLAIPIYIKGASSSKFFNYINKNLLSVFEKLSEEKKLNMLKTLAESSTHVCAQDARHLLPPILQLLKKYMLTRKTSDDLSCMLLLECLFYTFHQLASKTPNTTNSLCGYQIVTGQPSDRLGEDFTDLFKDFTDRLKIVEELAKATNKKLTEGVVELAKVMTDAKDEATKDELRAKQAKFVSGIRACTNVLSLIQPLHQRVPTFIGDQRIKLSWKETNSLSVALRTSSHGMKRGLKIENEAEYLKRAWNGERRTGGLNRAQKQGMRDERLASSRSWGVGRQERFRKARRFQ